MKKKNKLPALIGAEICLFDRWSDYDAVPFHLDDLNRV